MKIIAGKYANRNLSTKGISRKITRPVQAIIRKSVFSKLGDIRGLTVLDLFCGTGVMGIESLSRGCEYVIFADRNRHNIKILHENMQLLDEENYEAHAVDFRMALKAMNNNSKQADIIIADPPHKWVEKFSVLNYISKYNVLAPGGIVIHHMSRDRELEQEGFARIDSAVFGRNKFIIFREEN
ncbi:MAG: RsmD family RNA methyltransferase [candidate division WOR-3 bacterium]|nr:RsmD family RNA methyltransferase [candidate division WOR-3 bacterium]